MGPQHITTLLDALRTNSFVKHFLLGNNLIGPRGADALATFLQDHPDKIETWYLAGCCLDAPSFATFVSAIIPSTTCHSIWLKRNPLTAAAAPDIARLIIGARALRVLDLEQTQLGDAGAAKLFGLLADHLTSSTDASLALEMIYLNANGISHTACASLGRFLAAPNCNLQGLYLASNAIGDAGALALAPGLAQNKTLRRLVMRSVGLKTAGATAIFTAVAGHPSLETLDVAHAYTTPDLDVRYNYITDDAAPAIEDLLARCRTLRAFSLGITAMSAGALDALKPLLCSSGLYYYTGSSIHVRRMSKADEVRATLEANIQAQYGNDMTYGQFVEGPLRFLNSGEYVRYIDSVYRNRDAGKAKRGEMVLEKKWKEGDETLDIVWGAGDR